MVFVRVDELCVLANVADVAKDEGVLLGDAGVELVPDEGVDETVGTDPPLPDSALLMDAA